MDIVELTADRADLVAGAVALQNAVAEVDSPWVFPSTPASFTGLMRHGWDGEPATYFLALDGAAVVGQLSYETSEWDNTHLAWLEVAVRPDVRRRGIGSALMEHGLALARREEKTSVGSDGWDSTATRAFSARHGFEKKSQAINRRQFLDDVDFTLVQKLYDEAARSAADYELVRVVGQTPDEMIEAVSVMTAAINDAPLDDLEIEDEVFPPERVRAYEAATAARALRMYRLLARHRVTGELAGHTVLAVEGERPELGHQHDTSVVRAHRGHRLGLLLKAGMLRWLREAEPRLHVVDTWNAESNQHMIAVNEQLGYRVLGRVLEFQRPLA